MNVVPEPAAPTPGALRKIRVLVFGLGLREFGIYFYSLFLLIFFHSALHLTYIVAGLYILILSLAILPFGQIGGGISDRFGRYRLIVLSLAAQAFALAIMAWGFSIGSLAVVLPSLLVSRSFGVIGTPASYAYVADSTDITFRATGLSWMRVAANAGSFGGISLGGVLLTFISYSQLTALAALLVGAGAIVDAIWLTPTPRDLTISKRRSGAAPTSTLGSGVLRWLWEPIYNSFRPLWHDSTLLLVVFASILILLMQQQYVYAIPAFSLTYLGVPFAVLGLALSLTGLIPVLTQVPITKWLSGHRHTRVGIWGAAAYAVSYVAFGLDSNYRYAVVASVFAVMIVSTIGEDLIYLPVFTLPLNIAPEDTRGTYSGTLSTTSAIGGSLASLLAGVALTFASQPLVMWSILAAPAIPAITILSYLGTRIPPEHNRI